MILRKQSFDSDLIHKWNTATILFVLKNSLIQGENLEESEQPGEYIFMKNGLVSWHKLNIPSFASLISVL